MAKKSKRYEAAQQKAEAQFFEARKKAAEDAASNVAQLVEKCPVPYDFPYIENFMAWIGKAGEYRTDLPPSRVTVKAEDGIEYAVGVEMIDISEYPPIVKEVALMSFWLGAEIMRLAKSDPKLMRLALENNALLKKNIDKLQRHSAPDGTLIQEEELLKRFDNKSHELTKEKRWKAVSHEVLKEVKQSNGTMPSWMTLTIRSNIAKTVMDGITEAKAKYWAGRFSDITRRYERKKATQTGKTP